jgi:hypothetical protein
MKKQFIIPLLPVLLLACGQGSSTTDSANDAAGTGSPFEARRVTGTRLLTTDYKYDKICNLLDEGFIRNTFNVDALTKLTTYDSQKGCAYQWGDKEVKVSFGGPEPYSSLYDAERAFDKRFQPKAVDEIDTKPHKPSLFGPRPQGTGAERPAIRSPKPENDSLAIIHRDSDGEITSTRLTEPAYGTKNGIAIAGIGNKAIWEPDKRTLDVLYLQHIFSIQINTDSSPDTQQKRAIKLAQLVLNELKEADR